MAERPRKCPIGTVRTWESGDVIKAFDNSLFADGWMQLPSMPAGLREDVRELDDLGRSISWVRDPVDGMLWLDKEISEFKAPSGEVYEPSDFKQYSGYYGNKGYSFLSEFSKRYNRDKIQLASDTNDAVLEANKRACFAAGKDPESIFILSKEEVKAIKERVKASFKYGLSTFDSRDIPALKNILKRVNKYLKQGENFEDEEQKRIFEKNKNLRLTFTDEYGSLKQKKALKDQMLEEIDATFQDNWGIRESFRKKMEETYAVYIKKYLDRIKKEEVLEFEATIKCPINAPTEKFYKAIENSELKGIHINLEDYIGKKVPSSYSKYDEVKLVSIDYKNDEAWVINKYGDKVLYNYSDHCLQDLTDQLKSREGTDLGIIFQLRFSELYNKDLEGKWDVGSIEALHIFEKIMHYLPKGHCLTNYDFRKLQKSTNYDQASSYAHYSASDRAIYLSNKALAETDKFSPSLHDGNEFVATLIHEIGHSVSEKFSRAYKTKYRDFGRACGWSWQDLDKTDQSTYTATNQAPDTKRTGVNSNTELISKYAHKSPEEAFAEYYSFYSQYKKEIDLMLDHNDTSQLGAHKERIYNPDYGVTKSISDIINTHIEPHLRQEIDKTLMSQMRDISGSINLEFVSPWELKHPQIHEETIDKKQLRNYIDFVKKEDHKPVLSIIKQDGRRVLVGEEAEGYLNYANKIAKKLTPTCSITEEIYNNLKNKGYSDKDISDYAFYSIKDEKLPLGEGQKWKSLDLEGLRFGRDGIIPKEKIIKNRLPFEKMRKIYYSEELKKALESGEL